MRTVAENLEILYNSVQNIKQAITEKGGDVSGDITTWGNVISSIGSESGEIKPTANVFVSKLNGSSIGNHGTFYNLETILHMYDLAISDDEINDVIFYCQKQDSYYAKFKNQFLGPNYIVSNERRFGGVAIGENRWAGETIKPVYYDGENPALHIIVKNTGSYTTYSTNVYNFTVIVLCNDGTFDFDYGKINLSNSQCYIKDTNISLSNGITKKVQDINYNDELLVWNFDEGKFDKAKPLWIKKEERTNNYYKVTLDDGNIIGLVGSNGRCHRLFDYDDMVFESATELVGKNIHTLNGIHKVVSVENIQEEVEYYNIITDFHMNCFANGMLTSCRYNNLYPIKDMVFDKSTVELEPRWKINQEKFIPNPEILPKYVKGMRLDENTTMTIDEMKEYIINLENRRKTVLDFNSNEMSNNIEDTEVGWIDSEGKSYGFKMYMSGQHCHDVLAHKICKELNIETDNPYRYLEKEGWVKYTTDFVLNSDDKEINDTQLKSLQKFLKVPNKLKKEGKIRIGNILSPHTDISEFDNMDIRSFEHRKKQGRK